MMQLTPVRCGNAECRIPLDEPPNLPFDQRVSCPKCGAISRCFEVGVSCHVTITCDITVEHITLQVRQEARWRGMTVEEYLTALKGSVEVIQDFEELIKSQIRLVLRLWTMGEISPEELIRALPAVDRPPSELTGIPDGDYSPLCTGIIWKD